MWFERFVIIVTSIHRDFIPSAWSMYSPTWVEISIYLGSLGLFFTAFLVFAKTMPVIAMAEIKHILKVSGEAQKKEALAHSKEHGHEPQVVIHTA
jgi:molybdopterin-containing oxidoreductase family membrane subunit